jgi:hypothetical protein
MITQFRNQLSAVIALQQGDGLWTTSLLDSVQWPKHETSSTAFFCFAMAWGINNRILDSATFTPPMRKAWSGLVRNIAADGKLMYCQVVGTEPSDAMFDYYSSSEGEGALLLAGEEMWKMATVATVSVKRTTRDCHSECVLSRPLFIAIGQSATVAVPPRARRASLFDASGRCVWMRDVKNESRIRVPDWLGENRVLVVRFAF